MTNLAQISSNWIVSEDNGEATARPVNPYARYPNIHPDPRSKYWSWIDEAAKLPTFYTNHTPGSYKAEELGEVEHQLFDNGEWCGISEAAYCERNEENEFLFPMQRYLTRLYIKSKS